MAWNDETIMQLVPFKVPNMQTPSAPHIGYGVAGATSFGVPDLLFTFGGVNADAENLLAASPMMYQGLSRIAGAMRRMIDEIETAVAAGHVLRANVDYVLKNYEAVEGDCLTLMQIATNGVDATIKGMGAANGKR